MTQDSPGWGSGYIPTAAEWNAEFATKIDEADGHAVRLDIDDQLVIGAGSDNKLTLTPGASSGTSVVFSVSGSGGFKFGTGSDALTLGNGTLSGTTIRMGNVSGKHGFYGAEPVVRPTGVGDNSTDIRAALVALGLIEAGAGGGGPDPTPSFSDDFTTLDVVHLGDSGKWAYVRWYETDATTGYPVNDSWMVAADNPLTPITSLYSVSGGALRLGIEETPALYAADCGSLPHVGGQLVANTFSQLHGYFEARIRAPYIIGTNFAFWLMANGPWPPEIDIVEIVCLQSDGSQFPNQGLWHTDETIDEIHNYGADVAGWHTYGVDWQADTTTFYIDRVETGSFATPSGYTEPMFPLISSQNGAAEWTGAIPGDATLAPLEVDYVKVWTVKPF